MTTDLRAIHKALRAVISEHHMDLPWHAFTALVDIENDLSYLVNAASWEAARAAGEPMTRGQLYAGLYDGDDLPTADPA